MIPTSHFGESELSQSDDASILRLCHLVGVCLAQFSKIEESLAALYGITAEIPKMEIAFKTHDEIREFQYRLSATDAVVRSWITSHSNENVRKTLSEEWDILQRIIKEESQERNRIAHFTLAYDDNNDGTTTWFVCPYFQYYSHISAIMNQKSEKIKIPDGVKKFDVTSMEAKRRSFDKTAQRIDKFIGGLLEYGAQLPK